jgi:hypothetical protein
MLYNRAVGGTFIGRVMSGRIGLGFTAVTDYDRKTGVWTGSNVRAASANIVLQSNANGTPFWSLTDQELAQTLLHELGHVFDIVNSLGGSAIKNDVDPDGSTNWTQEAANAKALEKCKP